jgi:hypothetical protein
MKNLITSLSITLFGSMLCIGQINIQEYKRNHTLTYEKTIEAYQKLDDQFDDAKLIEMGNADCGKPLHIFIIDPTRQFNGANYQNRTVLLINNGIHPGEPCGVDASINFANDLLKDANYSQRISNIVIGIIPLYNVGGALNRGCCSRANQNGPENYGFRGNARNLDLNRDFIKMDSENAMIFAEIFHFLDPDILVDTHTSNGADYQYTMTLLTTQLDKLNPQLSIPVKSKLLPLLKEEMKQKGYPICPYVNTMQATPDSGIYAYMESPRYCTGYASLFNTIGFTTETHMWKPFADRVQSTYEFLKVIQDYANKSSTEILRARKRAFEHDSAKNVFPLDWKLDTTHYEMIQFMGYETEYYKSNVTGLETFRYNRDKPWTKKIKYYNKYSPVVAVNKPSHYILPQAWKEVHERLEKNGVKMTRLKSDSTIMTTAYFIQDHRTANRPYEGHYLHQNIKVITKKQLISFFKGDYIIPTEQRNVRFIIETLEPQGVDSYFAWNFFDEVLQQKEYFSHYVFEERAEEILSSQPALKTEFNQLKASDPDFEKNHWNQLYWIYKHSENYEPSHLRYPVFRIEID